MPVDRNKILAHVAAQQLEPGVARLLVVHVVNDLVTVPVLCRPLQRRRPALVDLARGDRSDGDAKTCRIHSRQQNIRIDLGGRIGDEPDVCRQDGDRQDLRSDIAWDERDVDLGQTRNIRHRFQHGSPLEESRLRARDLRTSLVSICRGPRAPSLVRLVGVAAARLDRDQSIGTPPDAAPRRRGFRIEDGRLIGSLGDILRTDAKQRTLIARCRYQARSRLGDRRDLICIGLQN